MHTRHLIASTIVCIIIVYTFYSCSSDKDKTKQNKQLHIYYGYIIDINQPIHKRLIYLQTLESVAKGKNIKLKKEALSYLRNARDLFSRQRQTRNNIEMLSKIDNVLDNLGYSISPHLSFIEEEKERRKQEIIKLNAKNRIDARLYGTWIRIEGNITKQYSFHNDSSFQYIEVAGEGLGSLEAKSGMNNRFVSAGKYDITQGKEGYKQFIVLSFNKSKRGIENKEYRIESNKLFLDKDSFLKR